ncbi:MAG: VWA domain-containing protein, partial [Anaerolineae bacterium]
GIYRIDLNTGAVELWARLDAGPDMHWQGPNRDSAGADWTGRVGLGDLEMAEDGGALLAVNLWDRRVYRLSVPGGQVIDSFPNGGTDTFWANDARPFALGVRGGYLYHGVVDSAESTFGGSLPTAFVFRSRPDGSDMREVVRIPMSYGRVLPWGPWIWAAPESMPGPPLLTDIEFQPDGDLVLGFRERNGDTTLLRAGHGDLLLAEWVAPAVAAVMNFNHYNDRVRHPETTWGSIASRPGADVVVTTGVDPETIWSGGAFWFDNKSGNVFGTETIYVTDRRRVTDPTFAKTSGLGDIESLCPPVATPTASPSPTTTATPTATRLPEPIYLPLILGERCTERRAHADIVLVLDVSTSMRRETAAGRRKMEAVQDAALLFLDQIRLTPDEAGSFDQVAIVGFNRDAWIAQSLTNRVADLQLAVQLLPDRMEQFTRLDLGLERGGEALSDPARRPDNRGVVVLLTDGLPNQVPYAEDGTMETTVLQAARALKAADISVFTIGVGRPDAPDPIDRINADLLRRVASQPDMFFQTPDAEQLGAIYGEIAVTIGCPPGRHKWGEPWP